MRVLRYNLHSARAAPTVDWTMKPLIKSGDRANPPAPRGAGGRDSFHLTGLFMLLRTAKRYVRRLRLRGLGVAEQVGINRLPLAYHHGGWMVHPDTLDERSIVYSFGVGSNIAWDLAMIERFGCTIHAFDPTPLSIDWVRAQNPPPKFVFHDFGVARFDGTMTFYPPRRRDSFNYSSIERGPTFDERELIRVPVKRVSTIMRELGHDHIDVLKMDIEGGEYDVLEDIVESRVKVGQILVEFHHNFRSVSLSRTVAAVRALNERGYRIFHLSNRSYEMSFINGPVAARAEAVDRSWLRQPATPGEVVEYFGTAAAADKYAGELWGTATHRRESRCVREGLAELPRGARVLDLPCGAGRLLPLLGEMGFAVMAADSSPHMVGKAKEIAVSMPAAATTIDFVVTDVFKTSFADDEFDGVVCNRLLHHFREPEIRQAALAELGRLTKGPIVVSFFCNRALDSALFHVRNFVLRHTPTDRIPISLGRMREDVKHAGLRIERVLPARFGLSKQFYLVLKRD